MRLLAAAIASSLLAACASQSLTKGPTSNSGGAAASSATSAPFADAVADPLALGKEFSCAIAPGGTVRCWGRNDTAQLGSGQRSPSIATPTLVANVSNAKAITAGGNHACALLSSGNVACWGRDDSVSGVDVVTRETATPMKGGERVRRVVAGNRHDCVLTEDRRVKCIGWGSDGQLGNGTQQASATLSDVVALTGVESIASGQLHSCALLQNGNAMCWGSGRYGRLGNAATNQYTFSMTPVEVVGMRDKVAQIALGGDRSCALTTRGGVKCWGRIRPGRVLTEQQVSDYAATPLEVSHLAEGVKEITAGGNHACALLRDGSVKCWGWNENGQLGNGSTTDTEEPAVVAGIHDAVALRAGDRHTCALLSSGGIMCWGANNFGQLGNGTKVDSAAPVAVTDSIKNEGTQ